MCKEVDENDQSPNPKCSGTTHQLMKNDSSIGLLSHLSILSSIKIFIYNIRRLNNKGKQRNLIDRIEREKSEFLILQETKVSTQDDKEIKNHCWKGRNLMALDSKGSNKVFTIIRNPQKIVFQDSVACQNILTKEPQGGVQPPPIVMQLQEIRGGKLKLPLAILTRVRLQLLLCNGNPTSKGSAYKNPQKNPNL